MRTVVSMISKKTYIFACDEHGDPGWPGGSKIFLFGGFAIESQNRSKLVSAWNRIKLNLCGNEECELKWSHFFYRRHKKNPLLSKDRWVRRQKARWALSKVFNMPRIFPINAYVIKEGKSDIHFVIKNGKKNLDIEAFWFGFLAQFALFLEEHKARGEIWSDKLTDIKREVKRQVSWEQIRKNQPKVQRIAHTIRYLDSKTEPLIQVADFVSGVIYRAVNEDMEFLNGFFDQYFPEGLRTYKLLRMD